MKKNKAFFYSAFWLILSFSSFGQEVDSLQSSSLEKMDSYIEENGRELGLSLCAQHTQGVYSLDLDMNKLPWEQGKHNLRIIFQGIIGNFHPAKNQYLGENQVPFLKFETHLGSYFIRSLTLSPQFAEATAVCFQKLADDPEVLQEKVQEFTRNVVLADWIFSIIPDFVVGAIIFKLFRVVKKGVQSTRFFQNLKRIEKKGNSPSPRVAQAKDTRAGRNLAVLKKGALILPIAYTANGVVATNFDFDLKSFLKGKGAKKIQEENDVIFPFQEYEKLIQWVLLWQKNALKLAQVVSSEEYTKASLQDLSSSLALREIIHANIFSSKKELLETILEMVSAVEMEPETSNLTLLLKDLAAWEASQRKRKRTNDCPENNQIAQLFLEKEHFKKQYQSLEDIFERVLLSD